MSDEEFESLLVDAVRELDQQPDPPQTLQRLVEITPEFFASCDFVGISLVQGDTITTPVASSEHLRVLDERQYVLGEGPCREAIRHDHTVIVDDLATDPRWPTWGHAMVSELDIRSSLSFRLFTRADRSFGALNLYSRTPHAFTEDDVVHGQTIAAMAAVVLARSINDDHLVAALGTRTVIGQATGILMERFELDSETAFGVLRRISNQENLKLRDLATQVVSTRRLPERDAPAEA